MNYFQIKLFELYADTVDLSYVFNDNMGMSMSEYKRVSLVIKNF